MDKKILLSGAAALLLVGNMYATPASASALSLSIGGEAKVTAGMSDKCFTAAADSADAFAFLDGAAGFGVTLSNGDATDLNTIETKLEALGHASGLDFTNTASGKTGNTIVLANGTVSEAAAAATNPNPLAVDYNGDGDVTDTALTGAQIIAATGETYRDIVDNLAVKNSDANITFLTDPCAGASEVIDWGYGKELSISASGTLANGLSISFSDTLDLTDTDKEEGSFEMSFDGAFGSLLVKDGASSAVDAVMLTNFDTGVLTGQKVGEGTRGRMATETSANAGKGFLYSAPSMGGIDFNLGWTPSGSNASTDAAEYENIFSFGATMSMDAITIAAGMETASSDTATAASCIANPNIAGTAVAVVNSVYGGDICGDQQLTYVGAEFSVSDLTLNAGWQKLDSDEADDTIYGLKAATSVGAYDLSVVYHNNKREYALGGVEDTQSSIGVGLSTALGDGVDLTFDFATNDVDLYSQSAAVGGPGSQNNYAAEFAIVAGF